jgi:hypothetical protein
LLQVRYVNHDGQVVTAGYSSVPAGNSVTSVRRSCALDLYHSHQDGS